MGSFLHFLVGFQFFEVSCDLNLSGFILTMLKKPVLPILFMLVVGTCLDLFSSTVRL